MPRRSFARFLDFGPLPAHLTEPELPGPCIHVSALQPHQLDTAGFVQRSVAATLSLFTSVVTYALVHFSAVSRPVSHELPRVWQTGTRIREYTDIVCAMHFATVYVYVWYYSMMCSFVHNHRQLKMLPTTNHH